MKNKRFNKSEIYKVKNHILNSFPHAYRVDVKVQKGKKGLFKSLIRVKAPQKKELVAIKTDENPKKSLEKSHLAIIKQIHKTKTRWKRSGSLGLRDLMAA